MYLKTWVKRFLAVFLSLSIMFLNIDVAQASVGRWIYSKAVAGVQGIKLGVTEVASGTKAVLLTDVTNPRQVGNLVGAVAAGAAVGQASDLAADLLFPWVGILKDLALDGVDYVLDPANNQIRYLPEGGDYCLETQCYSNKDSAVTAGLLSVSQYLSTRFGLSLTVSLLSVDANRVYLEFPHLLKKMRERQIKKGLSILLLIRLLFLVLLLNRVLYRFPMSLMR